MSEKDKEPGGAQEHTKVDFKVPPKATATATNAAATLATNHPQTLEQRQTNAKLAQEQANNDPTANRTAVEGASTAPVPAPAQQTTGHVNSTDLERPNTTNTRGADDVRSQMVSDPAAESSTDTVDQMLDPNSGTHQIPGDELSADDIEMAQIILDIQKRRGTRQDVVKEIMRRKAERHVAQSVRMGEVEGDGSKVYFHSSIPAFAFRPARGVRMHFKDNYFSTNNPGVIDYIRTQLMGVATSQIQITEVNQSDFEKDRTLVQPVIEPLPGFEGLDDIRLQRAALFTKAPRTENNPDPITPETGNGVRDQLSDRQLVSTAGEVRAAVQEHRDDVIQQRRNAAEIAAAEGHAPSADALANAGTTGGATAGATSTVNPPATSGGGFTTGMQGSTGPSSAPRVP